MDSLARQEAPTEKGEYSTPRIESKLQLRKKELNKIIWSKRTPNQSILGYNLSLRRRKRYRRKKKCWVCGSVDHLKAECPVHRESRLRQRVAELEERIQNLEDFINIQNINRKKRDKRKIFLVPRAAQATCAFCPTTPAFQAGLAKKSKRLSTSGKRKPIWTPVPLSARKTSGA